MIFGSAQSPAGRTAGTMIRSGRSSWIVVAGLATAACGHARASQGDDAGDPTDGQHASNDASHGDGSHADATTVFDAVAADAHVAVDASHDAAIGILTGGPCLSGSSGATAYRVRWIRAGSNAQVVYEVNGLPDHSHDHTAAYGYQIGFTPSYVDPFLDVGGVQLDGSDFIDIELTTAGVTNITSATLSIFGRSFDTTTSGSFNWQTFAGTGSSPTDLVSNVVPYAWYSADMTSEITAGDAMVLIRIKAGPSSDVLVVNRIELCLQAT